MEIPERVRERMKEMDERRARMDERRFRDPRIRPDSDGTIDHDEFLKNLKARQEARAQRDGMRSPEEIRKMMEMERVQRVRDDSL